jgi:hypothetical protein
MRLSEVLSKAPASEDLQVEGFLGSRRVPWGQHRTIEVGKVALNFNCKICGDARTFLSGDKLSCLVVGERVVSIDSCLRCLVCEAAVEAWFLVVSRGSLFERAPVVRLERFVENRRGVASRIGIGAGSFDDLFERAELAYEQGLGAGAMVYLRKIFEMLTHEVAEVAGVQSNGRKGGRKPYRELLKEVDEQHNIIPNAFSQDGYKLFSELSEVVHGESSEEVALQKFPHCRRLVVGVIKKVAEDSEMKQAVDALGWGLDDLDHLRGGEVAS